MLQTAAEHNILLKQIDPSQPLGPQGPFNVIIHKLRPNPGEVMRQVPHRLDHPQHMALFCLKVIHLVTVVHPV